MAFESMTLKDLRELALVYIGENDAHSHFGSKMNVWLNAGVRKMWDGCEGIEDIWSFRTTDGKRNYELPPNFLRDRLVTVDGDAIEYTGMENIDFLSTGTGRPKWYTFWGKPKIQLWVGPLTPGRSYTIQILGYRGPNMMVADDDQPEIPPQWRDAVAKYAAAQACNADLLPALRKDLLTEFEVERLDFQAWARNPSSANPGVVRYVSAY